MDQSKPSIDVKLYSHIVDTITARFPDLTIYTDFYSEGWNPFILIDSEEVFDNPEFKQLIAEFRGKYLWPVGNFETSFGYIDSSDELTPKHSILYDPIQGNCLKINFNKVAIVCVAFNNLQYTKQTLDTVLMYTSVPYKLFLVDNASTDGTLDYFNDLKKNSDASTYPIATEYLRPEIEIIHSDTNLGFAGGNNLALKKIKDNSEFTHVLLLNNDTLVTRDYIERFMYHLDSNQHAGMVGAVSNYVGGMQHVGNMHIEPQDTQKVAEEIYEKNKGKSIETSMLVAFCLFMKREVLDTVGLFDESLGKAMHEDNDLSLRFKLVGFKQYVAKDVFIYHFGSKTVNSAVNGRKQFLETRENFRNKWSKIRGEGHKKLVGMLRVRNGGEVLRKVLEGVSRMVDEIVVFDDRSTDNTEEICKSFPKVVDYFKSTYDTFDEARDRNQVFQMALKREPDFIFSFDADELPSERLIRDIQKIVNDPKSVEVDLWCFKISHLWNSETHQRTDGLWGNFLQGRLFRVYPNQSMVSQGDDGFHTGSTPKFCSMQTKVVPYTIIHYGNMDRAGRLRKYFWYTSTDKNKDVNAILGGWKDWYADLYGQIEEAKNKRLSEVNKTKVEENANGHAKGCK